MSFFLSNAVKYYFIKWHNKSMVAEARGENKKMHFYQSNFIFAIFKVTTQV